MLTLRYGDVRRLIGDVLSFCDDDPRILSYVNRAQQRLLYEGHWVGSYLRYQICTFGGCISWPRTIETIEKAALCTRPATVRNNWYEFLGAGPGILNGACSCAQSLVDQGEFPAFDDVTGTNKKLAVYCDQQEAAGKYITLQFYTGGAQWVRSTFAGEQIDGEKIALSSCFGTYVTTVNTCMAKGLVQVFKDLTIGNVRLYEFDTIAMTYKPLGYYEPDELIPVYRRSLVPGVCGTNINGGSVPGAVTVMGKRRFIPVLRDEDFLVIGYGEPIRLAAQAILKEENSKMAEAAQFWAMAFNLLNKQISHHQGSGAVVPIQISYQNSAAVLNMI